MSYSIGSLTIEMSANVARLQKDMADSKAVVSSTMKEIEGAVNLAKTAFIAMTGVASINAFKGMILGAIEGVAQMHALSIQAGMTVESLSGLAAVGKATGTSADTIAAASNKLSKALASANEDSKGAATALKALGLNFDDFQRMGPAERMQKIAVAMAGFKDGGEKSAASMFLFGKAGAEALPWLRDLAQAGELHARVTTEQAEAAHQFEVQLGKLKANGEAWRRSLAMDLLPTLNAFADALLGVKKSTGEVGHDLAEYLIPIMQNLAVWTIDAVYYFNKLAVTIGGTAAGYKAFFSGDFEGAKNIGKLMSEDAEKAKKKVDELSNAIRGIGLQSFDPNNQSAAEFARLTRKKDLTGLAGDPKGAASSDPINQGLSILDGLKTKYEQITGTVSVYEEAQRKMAAVKNGVGDAIRREIDAFAKLIDKTEAQTKAVDQMTRSQLAEITAREDAEKAADASLTALEKLAEAQQFEVDQLNKLAPAIALARFAREQGVMIRKAESDLVQRGQVEGWNEIKMEQERAKVTRESAAALDAFNKIQADAADQKNNPIRGAKDALKEYTDAIDSAGTISKKVMTDAFKGMEDALVGFVKNGKLDFSSLADGIITNLIRIQIQQSVMKPLETAMGGGDILGSLGSLLGFRAAGGPIDAGSPYIVGEKGPELIIPNNSGTVVPNHALGGGGSVTVNQPIVINAQNASAETVGMIRAMMPNIIAENKRVIEGVIQQAMARKGGRLTA